MKKSYNKKIKEILFKESSEFDNLPRPKKMARPKIEYVSLRSSDRPIDYGHCQQLLIDKYGKEKGEKYYEEVFVNANGNFGWTIASNIQKEKIAMFRDLKEIMGAQNFQNLFDFSDRPADLDDVNYFNLWQLWLKLMNDNGKLKRAKLKVENKTIKENLNIQEQEVVNLILAKDKELIEKKLRMINKLSTFINNGKNKKFVKECITTIKKNLHEKEYKDLVFQACELKETTKLFLEKNVEEGSITLPDMAHIKKIKMFAIENLEAPETIFIEFSVPFYPEGNNYSDIKETLEDINKRFSRLGTNMLNQTINWRPERNPYFTGTGIWEGSVRLFDVKPGSTVWGKGELALDTKVSENPISFSAYKPAVSALLTLLDQLLTKWFKDEITPENQQISLKEPSRKERGSYKAKDDEMEDDWYKAEEDGPSEEEIDKQAKEYALKHPELNL